MSSSRLSAGWEPLIVPSRWSAAADWPAATMVAARLLPMAAAHRARQHHQSGLQRGAAINQLQVVGQDE